MNLTIDIGNSYTKIGAFKENVLVEVKAFNNGAYDQLIEEINGYKESLGRIIVCIVTEQNNMFYEYLNSKYNVINLSKSTPIPIKNLYHSIETLGMDRLAAIVGSRHFFESGDVLVIDAGTCITYDFINKNDEYIGGSISPGLSMRYKALNNYTGKLPLVHSIDSTNLIGRSTLEAIKSGVINGTKSEIDSIIQKYKWSFPDLKAIITGGDGIFIQNQIKNSIFAAPNLVLYGLNEILKFNN